MHTIDSSTRKRQEHRSRVDCNQSLNSSHTTKGNYDVINSQFANRTEHASRKTSVTSAQTNPRFTNVSTRPLPKKRDVSQAKSTYDNRKPPLVNRRVITTRQFGPRSGASSSSERSSTLLRPNSQVNFARTRGISPKFNSNVDSKHGQQHTVLDKRLKLKTNFRKCEEKPCNARVNNNNNNNNNDQKCNVSRTMRHGANFERDYSLDRLSKVNPVYKARKMCRVSDTSMNNNNSKMSLTTSECSSGVDFVDSSNSSMCRHQESAVNRETVPGVRSRSNSSFVNLEKSDVTKYNQNQIQSYISRSINRESSELKLLLSQNNVNGLSGSKSYNFDENHSNLFVAFLVKHCLPKSILGTRFRQPFTWSTHIKKVFNNLEDIETIKKVICKELDYRLEVGKPFRIHQYDKLVLMRNINYAEAVKYGQKKGLDMGNVMSLFSETGSDRNIELQTLQAIRQVNEIVGEYYQEPVGINMIRQVAVECINKFRILERNKLENVPVISHMSKLLLGIIAREPMLSPRIQLEKYITKIEGQADEEPMSWNEHDSLCEEEERLANLIWVIEQHMMECTARMEMALKNDSSSRMFDSSEGSRDYVAADAKQSIVKPPNGVIGTGGNNSFSQTVHDWQQGKNQWLQEQIERWKHIGRSMESKVLCKERGMAVPNNSTAVVKSLDERTKKVPIVTSFTTPKLLDPISDVQSGRKSYERSSKNEDSERTYTTLLVAKKSPVEMYDKLKSEVDQLKQIIQNIEQKLYVKESPDGRTQNNVTEVVASKEVCNVPAVCESTDVVRSADQSREDMCTTCAQHIRDTCGSVNKDRDDSLVTKHGACQGPCEHESGECLNSTQAKVTSVESVPQNAELEFFSATNSSILHDLSKVNKQHQLQLGDSANVAVVGDKFEPNKAMNCFSGSKDFVVDATSNEPTLPNNAQNKEQVNSTCVECSTQTEHDSNVCNIQIISDQSKLANVTYPPNVNPNVVESYEPGILLLHHAKPFKVTETMDKTTSFHSFDMDTPEQNIKPLSSSNFVTECVTESDEQCAICVSKPPSEPVNPRLCESGLAVTTSYITESTQTGQELASNTNIECENPRPTETSHEIFDDCDFSNAPDTSSDAKNENAFNRANQQSSSGIHKNGRVYTHGNDGTDTESSALQKPASGQSTNLEVEAQRLGKKKLWDWMDQEYEKYQTCHKAAVELRNQYVCKGANTSSNTPLPVTSHNTPSNVNFSSDPIQCTTSSYNTYIRSIIQTQTAEYMERVSRKGLDDRDTIDMLDFIEHHEAFLERIDSVSVLKSKMNLVCNIMKDTMKMRTPLTLVNDEKCPEVSNSLPGVVEGHPPASSHGDEATFRVVYRDPNMYEVVSSLSVCNVHEHPNKAVCSSCGCDKDDQSNGSLAAQSPQLSRVALYEQAINEALEGILKRSSAETMNDPDVTPSQPPTELFSTFLDSSSSLKKSSVGNAVKTVSDGKSNRDVTDVQTKMPDRKSNSEQCNHTVTCKTMPNDSADDDVTNGTGATDVVKSSVNKKRLVSVPPSKTLKTGHESVSRDNPHARTSACLGTNVLARSLRLDNAIALRKNLATPPASEDGKRSSSGTTSKRTKKRDRCPKTQRSDGGNTSASREPDVARTHNTQETNKKDIAKALQHIQECPSCTQRLVPTLLQVVSRAADITINCPRCGVNVVAPMRTYAACGGTGGDAEAPGKRRKRSRHKS